MQEVDREAEAWFERDQDVQGWPALMIFPKTAWAKFDDLEVG